MSLDVHPTPESSSVAELAYDTQARELWVTFRDSGIYVYSWVSEQEWRDLLAAESKGGFVNARIKPDHLFRRP